MIYLIIAILCGSTFSILFKIFQRKNINCSQAIFYNYLTAIVTSFCPIITEMINSEQTSISDYIPSIPICLLALMVGSLFMAGFWTMDKSTYYCGVALTTISARAALFIPIILSWLLLSQPAPSWLPTILAFVAMLLIILPNSKNKELTPSTSFNSKTILSLIGVFFSYGIADFCLKLAQNTIKNNLVSDERLFPYQISSFTGMIFVMAAAVSLISCLRNKAFKDNSSLWRNIGGGILLGAANTGCTTSMLRALNELSTETFYPLYNVGIVVVASIAGICFFKERLQPLQMCGLVLAAIAITWQCM